MRKKIFVCIFFIINILTSCKKYDCPSWDDHYSNWLPYHLGQTVKFINQSDDTISYYIGSIEASDVYEIKKKYHGGCESYLYINLHNKFFCSITKYKDDFEILFSLVIKQDSVSFGGPFAFITRNLDKETNQINVNGTIYNNAVTVELDTLNYSIDQIRLWKIVIAKEYGLVAAYDRKTKDIWVLIH